MSDGFLGRWSRRKIEAKERVEQERLVEERLVEDATDAGDAQEARAGAVEPGAAPLAREPEALSEEEIAALPPIESLTIDADITPFLRSGVPKALKNAAMRKMWLLDPAIRDYRDVALDYAYDWNTPGGVPGNAGVITSDAARKMLDALLPKEEPPPLADAPDDAPGERSPPASPEPVAESAPVESPGAEQDADEGSELAAARPEPLSRPAAFAAIEPQESETPPRRKRNGGATPV